MLKKQKNNLTRGIIVPLIFREICQNLAPYLHTTIRFTQKNKPDKKNWYMTKYQIFTQRLY